MNKSKSYKKLLKIKERSTYDDYGWSDLESELNELEELMLKEFYEKEKRVS